MELFHFDIETCPLYKNYLAFSLNDEKGSKLFEKKFHKMKWDKEYDSIEDAYNEKAGLLSTYGKIICISCGFLDSNGNKKISSYYGNDEQEILNSFNKLLNKIEKKSFNLSGFKIEQFDIPWILHKMHKYNIKPSTMIDYYNKKPWEVRVTDMSVDWKLKFPINYSFDEMCYELDVESSKDKIDGSNVNELYWNNEIEKIKDYCEDDVRASIECGLKLYKK